MKKRLISTLLSAAMFVSALPAAFAASDIDNHWAKPYIQYLEQEEVYKPSATDGTYKPDQEMTRAEFMRYINRAFHFTEKASISYTDVKSGTWYYETIQIAKKYGYINGVSDTEMDPLGKVTREQAATIIGRLYKVDTTGVSPASLSFTDKSKISTWSAGYIKDAADKGFLAGYSDGSFQPEKVVTRAEVAKILYFYLGTSLSESGKSYTSESLKEDTNNVTISESCSLSHTVIEGDLYITEGVGKGKVTLNDVTVEGRIIASGGTITMANINCDDILVSSTLASVYHANTTNGMSA